MIRRTFLALAAGVLVFGCDDQPPSTPVGPDAPPVTGPRAAIVDGAHNDGNGDFFFLSPLVQDDPSTSDEFDEGEFNPNIASRVEVCLLATPVDGSGDLPDLTDVCATDAAGGDSLVAEFGFSEISVSTADEHYKVNWDTDGLDTDRFYRISVLVGERRVGFRDVDPAETDEETPTDSGEEVYHFKIGKNIPIKYRIENGLLCEVEPGPGQDIGDVCAEAAVSGADGGTVTTDNQDGVILEEGSFSTNDGVVTFVVERLFTDNGSCLATSGDGAFDLPQFEDCIRVRTFPDVGLLDEAALVQICDIDIPDDVLDQDQTERLRLHAGSDDGSPPFFVLPKAGTQCDVQTSSAAPAPSSGLLASVQSGVKWAGRTLATLVTPGELDAGSTSGLGGLSVSFSRFTAALPAQQEKVQGDDQIAPPGTTLAIDPTVLGTDAADAPVENARIHFEIIDAPDGATDVGSVSPASDSTDPDGLASTQWTLGDAPGEYTLRAFAVEIPPTGEGPVIADTNDPDDDGTFDPILLEENFVEFTATACEPGDGVGTATVDGTMSDGEWQCADSASFEANLSGGSSTPATSFWMNDSDSLYMALRVERDEKDKVNSLRVEFDDDGDGIAEEFDDAVFVDADDGAPGVFGDEYLTQKCVDRSQSGCGEPDPTGLHGSGVFSRQVIDGTSHVVYELSRPLDGDQYDYARSTGDLLGFFKILEIGNGAQGNTQWPGFREYKIITIK